MEESGPHVGPLGSTIFEIEIPVRQKVELNGRWGKVGRPEKGLGFRVLMMHTAY